MPRVCHFTGKKTSAGWKRVEKGARRDGGVGNKIKSRTKRPVKPNLKKMRVMIDGEVKSVYVSARALKSGLVIRPSRTLKVAATT